MNRRAPHLILSLCLTAFIQAAVGQQEPSRQSLELECPPMQYFADPDIKAEVETEGDGFTYRYRLRLEGDDESISRFYLMGNFESPGTLLEDWSGGFKDCYTLEGMVSCLWSRQAKQGEIVVQSTLAPAPGRYVVTSAISPLLTEELKAELLPLFNHDEAWLTEALIEAAMEQCASASVTSKYGRDMTGAIPVPYSDTPSVKEATSSAEIAETFDTALDSARTTAAEMRTEDQSKALVRIQDSSGRDLLYMLPDSNKPLETGTSEDFAPRCNVRALFVETFRTEALRNTQDPRYPGVKVSADARPIERRSIVWERAPTCEREPESFFLDIPR